MEKKRILISGINITQGGPLTILRYFRDYLASTLAGQYDIIFLVKDKALLNQENISTIEFPSSQRTIFHKIYYEYFYFKKLSKTLKPFLWLSLNDVTPTVSAEIRGTYFHNATPFYRLSALDFIFPSRVLLQKFYYHFFYRINLRQNDFVIVQQNFLKDYVRNVLVFPGEILINRPAIDTKHSVFQQFSTKDHVKFFYPTKPDVYKNIHILVEAVAQLKKSQSKLKSFSITLTFTGDENRYARYLKKRMSNYPEFMLSGYLDQVALHQQYIDSDCLLFPSKLETWGLPLSEAAQHQKQIIAADLPYAHETLRDYPAAFFNPDDAAELAKEMEKVLTGNIMGDNSGKEKMPSVDSVSLDQLFSRILSKENAPRGPEHI